MNFRHFDLNLLMALDGLLTERNVTRAARQLSVTQQAMSGSLHRLREYFGDELLVRSGRQMDLSPLARSLATPVREAILKTETMLSNKSEPDLRSAARRVRIAMSDYASLLILSDVLAALAKDAPHVDIVIERPTEQNIRGIESGMIDLCLVTGNRNLYFRYEPSIAVHCSPLLRDDYVCVVDRASPLARSQITLADYQSAKHVVTKLDAGMETMVEHEWKLAGFRPDVAASAPNFTTLIFMLPGTPLIATVQRNLALRLAPPLGLAIVPCPLAMSQIQIDMIWHARSEPDPVLMHVSGLIQSAARKLDCAYKP